MKSSADTMRPAGDVLQDLSEKWSTLSDVEKNNIAQQAAGEINAPYHGNMVA